MTMMSAHRALILCVSPGEIRGLISEQGQVIDLCLERDEGGSLVGVLFLGRILRVLPALPGCFVDLGLDRPAFLPGLELPGGLMPVEGAKLLVQVVKDAFDDKPHEVTASLSFHGRLGVWTPGKPGIAVSRQLAPAERARLSALLAPLIEPGEGIVVRSHAFGAQADDLAQDVETLRRQYQAIMTAIAGMKPPVRLDREVGALERVLLAAGPQCGTILVNDRAAYAEARQILMRREPSLVPLLQCDQGADFAGRHGIDAAFDQALDPFVSLSGGGDLVIELATGFCAIDVNLGSAAGGRGRSHEIIRAVNRAAALEIARQIRLRAIGGAIVVDFISMSVRDHRAEIAACLAEAVSSDPVPVECHGWTRLGHFELTRKRMGQSLADRMLAPGSIRRVRSARTTALAALRQMRSAPFRVGVMIVKVAPAVADALKGPLAPFMAELTRTIGRDIRVEAETGRDDESIDLL